MRARLRRSQRLRTRRQFEQVFRRGVRREGSLFTLVAAANGRSEDRLGLVVGRRIGGAVQRNRIRRLLRESFRRLARPGTAGLDLVILARAGLVRRRQGEVEHELERRLGEISRAARARRPPPAAAG